MQIQFNDEPMQCAEGQTVSGLLTELNQLKPGAALALNQQILHRVRLGPISTPGEVTQLQDSVRLANLGQPTLVKGE